MESLIAYQRFSSHYSIITQWVLSTGVRESPGGLVVESLSNRESRMSGCLLDSLETTIHALRAGKTSAAGIREGNP